MSRHSTLLYLTLLGLLFAHISYSQTGTTRGEEFYISMMPNASNVNDNEIRIYFSTLVRANVSVEIIGSDFKQNFVLAANTELDIFIPAEFFPVNTEQIEAIGIYVESDAEISVYAINQANATTDGSMILPYTSLGDEYLINSYNVLPPQTSITPQQFSVLATEDSTLVDITFTARTNIENVFSFQAGESTTIELMRGEQIYFSSVDDMTGTLVRSRPADDGTCKKIAVFAGHNTTLVGPEQGPDHLYNQMYPVSEWGKEYVALPFETRFTGDPIKILAAENNTRVTINGSPITLNRGQWSITEVLAPTYIAADKPISVIQLTKGRQADNDIRADEFADPFMFALSPANQIVKDLGFVVMTTPRMVRHYVQVVTLTQNLNVTLNGNDISDRFEPVAANPVYSHATFTLNPAFHQMSSTNGFVAHSYAFGEAESIGYALGGDLGDFDVTIEDSQLGIVSNGNFAATICQASELTLTVSSDIPALKDAYTVFEWDMGDGTILYGDVVKHKYAGPGQYAIRMTAFRGSNNCTSVFVDRLIEVVPDGIEAIEGPVSVCPDAEDIVYNAAGIIPDYTYEWFVDGGSIDGSRTGTSVTIDWDIANPGARVRVVARSPIGCLSDTLDLPIVLNEFLEPARPTGPAQLCTEDISAIGYNTFPANGSTYTWFADGGTIVSGQGTHEVLVEWDGIGTHSIWFVESATTNSSLCDGTSPPLEVIVYDPLIITPAITPVSCFGESDGMINLDISGGLGPYDVRWRTGEAGETLTGLVAGDYTVVVTDALGCILEQEVSMSQPALLEGFMDVQDALCNGFRGTATANVNGGVAPYRYEWSTNAVTNTNTLDRLNSGSYSVRITDANDCEINLNFRVEEPSALVAELTMEQACPDAADGSLSLDVTGGTAPYTYNWVFDPSESASSVTDIAAGNYDVTVVDAAGCSLELNGEVTNLTPRINFPTAFSPNGDGWNDEFKAVFNCALDFRMLIFNRWGNIIFQSRDINVGWNGEVDGEPAPDGSYTYEIQYNGTFNGRPFFETVRGYIRVAR